MGKGGKDVLYEVDETKSFDLPMTLDLINGDRDWDWSACSRVKKVYAEFISKRERELLSEARREKYVSLNDEERVTGDYVVGVKCSVQVVWTRLSYEEYSSLKQQSKE
jgi:hypothetical protein